MALATPVATSTTSTEIGADDGVNESIHPARDRGVASTASRRPSVSSSRIRSTTCTPAAAATAPTRTMTAEISVRPMSLVTGVPEALQDALDLRVAECSRPRSR